MVARAMISFPVVAAKRIMVPPPSSTRLTMAQLRGQDKSGTTMGPWVQLFFSKGFMGFSSLGTRVHKHIKPLSVTLAIHGDIESHYVHSRLDARCCAKAYGE